MELTQPEIPEWYDDAQCIGTSTNIFFSSVGEDGEGVPAMVSIAKSICGACMVRAQCLNFAMDTNEKNGIWGGLTARERRRLRVRLGRQ